MYYVLFTMNYFISFDHSVTLFLCFYLIILLIIFRLFYRWIFFKFFIVAKLLMNETEPYLLHYLS